MTEQNRVLLAIVLSALILVGWQLLFGVPRVEKQAIPQHAQEERGLPPTPAQPGPTSLATRATALAASPRIRIDTPLLAGSIALKGGRIDDLSLVRYRQTVDPNSSSVVLLSPSGGPDPFYAEFGWLAAVQAKLPGPDTNWQQEGSGALSVDHPVTLVYDDGAGLEFRRTIAVDDKSLFTINDQVVNKGAAPVTLYPYARIVRQGTPPTLGFYILHEGLIGVMGDQGLKEWTYSKIEGKKIDSYDVTDAWLGITDKYWAAALIPDTTAGLHADFSYNLVNAIKVYQADYRLDAQTIAPGATGVAQARLFAGAKEVSTVDRYNKQLGLNNFDLLIDWGWFYFITKPMFLAIDWIYHRVGNFGIAILIITIAIKILFFPLANKSYASMAKMKAVQPEMMAIRERYPDDKLKQQQAMMELYKKEKINPVSGCLPMLIQVPVFFSLYKVLFITIEMRHAPFFGWIKDLSAPDPLTVFNLFGLIPWDPTAVPMVGPFLHLGPWPLIMGVTMWLQMKLNPPPPDPTQATVFNYLPILFTLMLAKFPVGLVIYWAWNNTLSIIQQSVIMHKHGAKIELWNNLAASFVRRKRTER